LKSQFKQYWSTIPPISTTSHLKSLNSTNTIFAYGNAGYGLGQAQMFGGAKSVNGILTLLPRDNWISNENAD
jgi:hypothetical protein